MKGHRRFAIWASADGDRIDVAQKMGVMNWDSLRNSALSAYGIELLDTGVHMFIDRLRERIAAQRRIAL